jgi:hypothetical protein
LHDIGIIDSRTALLLKAVAFIHLKNGWLEGGGGRAREGPSGAVDTGRKIHSQYNVVPGINQFFFITTSFYCNYHPTTSTNRLPFTLQIRT